MERSTPSPNTRRVRLAMLVGSVIVAVCVPGMIISSSVNALIFDAGYYASRQATYAVGRSTEYTIGQLLPINSALVLFFADPNVTLPNALSKSGASPAVFSEREIGHMNDVRSIIRGLVTLQWWSAAIITVMIIASIYSEGRRGLRRTAGGLATGAVLTLLLIAAIGLLSLTDFERVFLTFHQLSFDNDLWLLDPRTDNLIRFFPFEFWFDATVTVAQRSIFASVGTLLVAMIGRWILRSTAVTS